MGEYDINWLDKKLSKLQLFGAKIRKIDGVYYATLNDTHYVLIPDNVKNLYYLEINEKSKEIKFLGGRGLKHCIGFLGSRRYNRLDFSNFRTDKIINTTMLFEKVEADELVMPQMGFPSSTDFYGMFREARIGVLNFNKMDTSMITDMSEMFKYGNFGTVDMTGLDTSNVTDMTNMFYNTSIIQLIMGIDTSSVTDMSGMFFRAEIKNLNTKSFNTSNVKNMSGMFGYCGLDELNLSNFDTSKVETMECMFLQSKVKNLDISSFNTSNVRDMHGMFTACVTDKLDLSSFDTSKVTNMQRMFLKSNIEEVGLSSFKINTTIEDCCEHMFDDARINKISITDEKLKSEAVAITLTLNKEIKTWWNC